MNPDEQRPAQDDTTEAPQGEQTPPAFMHTYETDLARSMDATDAPAVQALLEDARTREREMKEAQEERRARGWYSFFSILLLIVAIASFGYAYIHYRSLTVPLTDSVRLGVFTTTAPIVASTTDIRQLSGTIRETALGKNRPVLAQLVEDDTSLTLLSEEALYEFMESVPSASFRNAIASSRLGYMNTGTTVLPFIIMSVSDTDIATKEFLIAEPTLLETFYKPLSIDLSMHTAEIGKGFVSEYAYNLPVRVLRYPNTSTGTDETLLLYGTVAPRVFVITTHPDVLRGIYDTIIRQ